jgi:hypothetical protein
MLINVVDASNLERNLYLTLQLLELGIPCVVALNMLDIAEKQKSALISTPSPLASAARLFRWSPPAVAVSTR